MIRKSLLIGVVSLLLIGQAHASPRENMVEFFSDQLARGTVIQPAPFRAVERVVRVSGHYLGRAGGYVVDHVSPVYERASGVVGEASRYLGTNPTGWAHNWCAEFANRVLAREGYATSGSAMAISFAHYGPHVAPQPGAIAVLPHHVGFVESVLPDGSIVLVSGNGGRRFGVHGRVTARSVYSARRFVAFVMPRRA